MSITMSEVNQKVANLTNTTATTPISLSELNKKVDNASATGKDWAIFTYVDATTLTFDPKYDSYNYEIVEIELDTDSPVYVRMNRDELNARPKLNARGGTIHFMRRSGVIRINPINMGAPRSIKILFYK